MNTATNIRRKKTMSNDNKFHIDIRLLRILEINSLLYKTLSIVILLPFVDIVFIQSLLLLIEFNKVYRV